MSDKSLITCIQWVQRGFAKKFPTEIQTDVKDINELKNDPEINQQMQQMNQQVDDEYNMENYDDEIDVPNFAEETSMLKRKKEDEDEWWDEISEEEKEDYTIKKTDSILVASKIENEFSSLEIYIYEEKSYNLFVHHDITLSAFPLSLEWLQINPFSSIEDTKKGNYIIVGTFLPDIEIWNLDTLNSIEPDMVLGNEQDLSSYKKPKKNKQNQNKQGQGHTDSVICLNLNQQRKNLLASSSADCSIKLWDLFQKKCVQTYEYHTDKVQVVKWNPQEDNILMSGSFDKTLSIIDVRDPNGKKLSRSINSDIEQALWDPSNPTNIIFCTEDGTITGVDVRKFQDEPLFHFQAHQKVVTSISMSSQVNGMLSSVSEDGFIKIWDVQQLTDNGPQLIAQKQAKAEKLYCCSFYEDSPWILACGSSIGEVVIWDLAENTKLLQNFENRCTGKAQENLNQKINQIEQE